MAMAMPDDGDVDAAVGVVAGAGVDIPEIKCCWCVFSPAASAAAWFIITAITSTFRY
jgi:hypothetical protein